MSIPQAAIDQHAIARDRLGDMIPVIEQRPHLLGISLDEGAALHVHGGIATVMGISRVAIHDARRWPEGGPEGERYRLIGPGDRFDLERRLLLE